MIVGIVIGLVVGVAIGYITAGILCRSDDSGRRG